MQSKVVPLDGVSCSQGRISGASPRQTDIHQTAFAVCRPKMAPDPHAQSCPAEPLSTQGAVESTYHSECADAATKVARRGNMPQGC